jgi:hypothetical protein
VVLASLTRGDLSRLVRRHRRIVAAALAALATLIVITSLPHGAATVATDEPPGLSSDEVAIPITLENRAVAEALHAGDRVSVVAVSDDGFSSIVAESARVLSESPGGFGATDSAVTLAVDEGSALRLAGAQATNTLTVIIRPPAS